MHYLITGAGQIGTQLAADLTTAGHEVTVLRRGEGQVDGTTTVRGDAGDPGTLRQLADGAGAIFHCIHSSYDAATWEKDLPQREAAVMDVAAELGIPVVFPESVYAFGREAQDLTADALRRTPVPVAPLGEIRARLLAARAAHPAVTLSVVAADLIGPTAAPQTSVFLLTVLGPAAKGRTAWVLGDPDVPRSVTYIPDLTAAMVTAAQRAEELAPEGSVVLSAATTATLSQREMADAVAPGGTAGVRHIPWWVLSVFGRFSPMMRELRNQRYLWDAPAVIGRGVLEERYGLRPTPWEQAVG